MDPSGKHLSRQSRKFSEVFRKDFQTVCSRQFFFLVSQNIWFIWLAFHISLPSFELNLIFHFMIGSPIKVPIKLYKGLKGKTQIHHIGNCQLQNSTKRKLWSWIPEYDLFPKGHFFKSLVVYQIWCSWCSWCRASMVAAQMYLLMGWEHASLAKSFFINHCRTVTVTLFYSTVTLSLYHVKVETNVYIWHICVKGCLWNWTDKLTCFFFFKWCFLSNVQNIFPQSSAASLRNIRPGTKRLKYKTWLLPNLHFGLFSAEISLDFNFTGDCFEKKYFLFWKIKFPLISSAFLYSVNCLNSTSSSTWSIWKLHCRLHKGSYILKIRFYQEK